MPRRYRRRRYYPIQRSIKSVRYSAENYDSFYSVNLQTDTQYNIPFVYATELGGMRKAKNFTLNFDTTSEIPFLFALVYLPQGTTINTLNLVGENASHNPQAGSLYEPNQNVILSGTFGGPGTSHSKYFSRLARNLNSGDAILLIYRPVATTTEATFVSVIATLSFAIAY